MNLDDQLITARIAFDIKNKEKKIINLLFFFFFFGFFQKKQHLCISCRHKRQVKQISTNVSVIMKLYINKVHTRLGDVKFLWYSLVKYICYVI